MAADPLPRVLRADTPVRYVEDTDDPEGIRTAWDRLESVLGSLRSHHFVGAFDPAQGWYRACVEIRADGPADSPGLRSWMVPGGPYVRVRLRGEPPEVYARITGAYEAMLARAVRDESRPSLEHYRRRDEIDLLLPVE